MGGKIFLVTVMILYEYEIVLKSTEVRDTFISSILYFNCRLCFFNQECVYEWK